MSPPSLENDAPLNRGKGVRTETTVLHSGDRSRNAHSSSQHLTRSVSASHYQLDDTNEFHHNNVNTTRPGRAPGGWSTPQQQQEHPYRGRAGTSSTCCITNLESATQPDLLQQRHCTKIVQSLHEPDGFRMDMNIAFRHKNEATFYVDSVGSVHGPMDQQHSTKLKSLEKKSEFLPGTHIIKAIETLTDLEKNIAHREQQMQSSRQDATPRIGHDRQHSTGSATVTSTAHHRLRTSSQQLDRLLTELSHSRGKRRSVQAQGPTPVGGRTEFYANGNTHIYRQSQFVSGNNSPAVSTSGTHYSTRLTRDHQATLDEGMFASRSFGVNQIGRIPDGIYVNRVDSQMNVTNNDGTVEAQPADNPDNRERLLIDELKRTREELANLRRSYSVTNVEHLNDFTPVPELAKEPSTRNNRSTTERIYINANFAPPPLQSHCQHSQDSGKYRTDHGRSVAKQQHSTTVKIHKSHDGRPSHGTLDRHRHHSTGFNLSDNDLRVSLLPKRRTLSRAQSNNQMFMNEDLGAISSLLNSERSHKKRQHFSSSQVSGGFEDQQPINTYSAHQENIINSHLSGDNQTNQVYTSRQRQHHSTDKKIIEHPTKVVEEIETISLQPIGKGVRDLEPNCIHSSTGEVNTLLSSRVSRVNTPNNYRESGDISSSTLLKPGSAATRVKSPSTLGHQRLHASTQNLQDRSSSFFFQNQHQQQQVSLTRNGEVGSLPRRKSDGGPVDSMRVNKWNNNSYEKPNIEKMSRVKTPASTYGKSFDQQQKSFLSSLLSQSKTKENATTSNLIIASSGAGSSTYGGASNPSTNQNYLNRPTINASGGCGLDSQRQTYSHQNAVITLAQVQEAAKSWYKPNISRDEAIILLKFQQPGAFIVRDSTTFTGAFGLAVKVATLPPKVTRKSDDIQSELVRHYLIEPVPMLGVRLKGFAQEPVFPTLVELIHQHILQAIALPVRLLLEEIDMPSLQQHSFHQSDQLDNGISENRQLLNIKNGYIDSSNNGCHNEKYLSMPISSAFDKQQYNHSLTNDQYQQQTCRNSRASNTQNSVEVERIDYATRNETLINKNVATIARDNIHQEQQFFHQNVLPTNSPSIFVGNDIGERPYSYHSMDGESIYEAFYLGSCTVDCSEGYRSLKTSIDQILQRLRSQSAEGHSECLVQVSMLDGITLTDVRRKHFVRRNFPISLITYCSLDPKERKYHISTGIDEPKPSKSRQTIEKVACLGNLFKTSGKHDNSVFAFIVRKASDMTSPVALQQEGTCHVLCENTHSSHSAALIVHDILKAIQSQAVVVP